MTKYSRKLKYFAISLVLVAMILPILSAKADQIFAYSDDLSSNFNLDMGQTRAKLVGGMAFTADDSVSSDITSDIVANPIKDIISARIDALDSNSSNTRIVYFISNNAGQRWMQVNPGFTYSFDTVGNQLSWRAVIARDSLVVPSASIDSINLAYTVSDTLQVNPNNIYNGSGYTSGSTLNSGSILNDGGDVNSYVCGVLSLVGLGCGASSPSSYVATVKTTAPFIPNAAAASSNIYNNSGLVATIFSSGQKQAGTDSVNLVRVKNKSEIYEIVSGKKHLIPTMDIFYDYGFKLEWVQNITQKQLNKYPRVELMQVAGDKNKTYYFTEGGMIRLIPDKNVSSSYGDRNEDIIIISKKEFNFYPQDQFVFLENQLSHDVFQLIKGSIKRYVTPQAVKRMKIDPEQIAPINQTELDAYKTDKPIVL